MRSRMRVLLLAGSALAASLAGARPAAAGVIFNERQPFSFVVFNDCTGEPFLVEGIFHQVVSESRGKIHARLNAHGIGVGLFSENTYVWNDTIHDDIVDPDPGCGFQVVTHQKLRISSKGALPNLKLRLALVFTEDESCNFNFEVLVDEITCQGAESP